MQQEQQQNGGQFGRWFHHDSELPAEPPNQIQQCVCLSACLSLSQPGGLLITGSKYDVGELVMFNVNLLHVYFDSDNRSSFESNRTPRKYEVRNTFAQ